MDLKEFKAEHADDKATGKPTRDVRSAGDDSQLLASLRTAFKEVSASTTTTSSVATDSNIQAFVELDTDFGDYFKTIADLDTVLKKFLDPKTEATKGDSALLQELLATEKRMLDSFQKKAAHDSAYGEKMTGLQHDTGVQLRKQSFHDGEFARASKLWNTKSANMFEAMESHLESFSTGFMSDTGSSIIGGLFGQEIGFFAKTAFEAMPKLARGAKQLPDQFRQAKATAGNVRDRIKMTRQLLRNKSIQSISKSILKGGVDLTDTEFANDLLDAQKQLESSQEELPKELNGELDELKDVLGEIKAGEEVSADTLDKIQEKAAEVADSSEVVAEINDLRDTETPGETLANIVAEGKGTEIASEISDSTDLLSDIREAALEMMVYLDDLNDKANQILGGTRKADSNLIKTLEDMREKSAKSSGEIVNSTKNVIPEIVDMREELAGDFHVQKAIAEAEDKSRDDTAKFQKDLVKAVKESKGGGGGGGGMLDGLGSLLGNRLLGKRGRKVLSKLGGGRIAKVLGRVGGGKVAKILGGGALATGASALFSGGTEAIAKTGGGAAVKAGGKGILKSIGKVGGRLGGGGLMKVLGKTAGKAGGKSFLKKIPVVGLLAGLGFGAKRLMDGDGLGALGEIASGAASLIPGIGTAASLAIDAGMAARDIKAELDATNETVAEIVPDEFEQNLQNGMEAEMARPDQTVVHKEIIREVQAPRAAPAPVPQPSPHKAPSEIPVMIDDLGLLLVSSSKM